MKHPAPFPPKILAVLRTATAELPDDAAIFDPFCGAGGIAEIRPGKLRCYGMEIEDEWAAVACARGVYCITGDIGSKAIQFTNYDAVVTSPCYGNRMADNYAPAPDPKHRMRRTYRLALGHELTKNNAGGMQWGAEYRNLHGFAWLKATDALRPGGLFVGHYAAGDWRVRVYCGSWCWTWISPSKPLDTAPGVR